MNFPIADKMEFVYKYRKELIGITKHILCHYPSKSYYWPIIKHIAHRARIEIGYSNSTCHADVVWQLLSVKEKLIKSDNYE